jgi:cytochrome b6-f complex iron-sulfur subunit
MAHDSQPDPVDDRSEEVSRRGLLGVSSRALMLAGVAGGYGLFAWVGARFMLPARVGEVQQLFVTRVADLAVGGSLLYRTPNGRTVNITRQSGGTAAEDFIALSSTCPHLGCQVRWEPPNNRYFCPCHNGTFDTSGKATGGPPGEAGQSLPRYGLRTANGLLYIEVPVESLSAPAQAGLVDVASPQGPGHDPCLTCLQRRGSASGGEGGA